MARLAAGVRKRSDGTFEKRFTVDGNRYSVYGKNSKECETKEREMRKQIEAGLYTSNRNITLSEYFKEWQAEKGAMFWETFMADKPADFNICIENVLEDEPFMLADMMSRIKDSRIGICLDTGHANAMTSAGVSIDDWVRVLSPYIRHFHLHNNDGYSDSHSSFDEGTIDMKHLLDTIEKNCRGNLTFTVEARQCAECLAWLKKHKYI